MSLLLRHVLVMAALSFWLGGFTFYAGVVVPLGQRILGGADQALVTRQVSVYLNLAALAAMLPLVWDIYADTASHRLRILRLFCCLGILLTLFALYLLHADMSELLDAAEAPIVRQPSFRYRHKAYLWISTVQWGCGVMQLIATLVSWRATDRQALGKRGNGGVQAVKGPIAEEEKKESPAVDFSGVAQSPKSPADGTKRL
jgi:hypothetical protein